MSKSIMISIKSEHVVNILNGKKTLELRKSVPKDFVGWVYIYVTKAKPYLYEGAFEYKTSPTTAIRTTESVEWNGGLLK